MTCEACFNLHAKPLHKLRTGKPITHDLGISMSKKLVSQTSFAIHVETRIYQNVLDTGRIFLIKLSCMAIYLFVITQTKRVETSMFLTYLACKRIIPGNL